jgi:hypothetical protein
MHALVIGKVGKRRRRAVLLQIAWRCAEESAIRHDAPRVEPFVGQRTEADGQIDTSVYEIDRPVGDVKLYFYMRMTFCELGNKRRDRGAAKPQRRVHTQQSSRHRPAG